MTRRRKIGAYGICRDEAGRVLLVRASDRAVYQVAVADPGTPQVQEVGGSTAAAGWFTAGEAAALPMTEIAGSFVRRL